MRAESTLGRIKSEFGSRVTAVEDSGAHPHVMVEEGALQEILLFCKENSECKMDFFECLTVLDMGAHLEAIYRLYSTALGKHATIKVEVPSSGELSSSANLWVGASGYEREAAEMFGIKFLGHPNPGPLLLPKDWKGFPLRKDYVFPESFAGIEHRRPPQRKEHFKP